MLSWKFFLNNVEVDEPLMFDGLSLLLSRSETYYGLENIFTEQNLEFYGLGAKIIKEVFDKDGFDGELDFKLQCFCNGNLESELNWIILLMFYSNTEGMVKVRASDSTLKVKFKNRMDTKINLDNTKSVGGTTLTAAPYKTIGLHSKALIKIGILDIENYPVVKTYTTVEQPGDSGGYYIQPWYDRSKSDFDVSLPIIDTIIHNPSIQQLFEANPLLYSATGGTFQVSLSQNITITTPFIAFQAAIVIGSSLNDPDGQAFQVFPFTDIIGSLDINFSFAKQVTIPPGKSLYYYFQVAYVNNYNQDITIKYNNLSANIFTIEDNKQTEEPTTCRGLLIHDAFQRVCEHITDQQGIFKSEFFGLKETYPYYENNGCAGYCLITNGKNIRNMRQKDNTYYPMSVSFQELYQSMDAIYSLGMRIEQAPFGKFIIRVEPKSFFFKKENSLTYDNVAGIKTEPAKNYVFNSIDIGYDKWNLNQGGINGIDEFNTSHTYTLPVKFADKKITAKSSFIASGYVIEQTRRIQYDSNVSTDFETDDTNFIICLNQKEVSTKVYNINNELKSYAPGTVSERNEDFPVVENLISPETAYNLRISPARNLLRWWPFISPTLWYKIKNDPFAFIKFQSGEGNVLLKSLQQGGCAEAKGPLQENQNISQFDLLSPISLFTPVLVNFEYPTSLNDFNKIRDRSNWSIKYSCNCVEFSSASVNSLSFLPVGENGGIGEYQLLMIGNQEAAAFDYGFTQGFDS